MDAMFGRYLAARLDPRRRAEPEGLAETADSPAALIDLLTNTPGLPRIFTIQQGNRDAQRMEPWGFVFGSDAARVASAR
ncbi:MAG TPA: hypothetical protein VN043_15035 [Rhodanobacter sp.]|nr:hypothetical protein [Rhodanobacter sp.]